MRPERTPCGWWRATLALLVSIAVSLFAAPARASEPPPSEPLVFVVDPKMGVETSVRTIDSLGRVAFHYEDALPTIKLPYGVFGVFGRSLKLLFIDEPIAELSALFTHEAGGHGARGRELGLRPTFLFYPPGIYRLLFTPKGEDSVGGFTQFQTAGLIEEPREITSTLGGIEADYVHAWWINARIVRTQGWAHHGDLLVYAASRLSYAEWFLSPSIQRRGGDSSSNDVDSYVTSLQEISNGWRAEDRRRIARRLAAGSLWNLVDPTLLWSLYSTIRTLSLGERHTQMPLPTIGGTSMLLSPRFGLTPFGAEQILDVFLADPKGRLLDVYARLGTSGLASYYGAGARVLGLRMTDRLTLGGELDVWRQPQILLDQRGVFDPPRRVGLNAGMFVDVRLTKELSVTGKLAAKTAGYVMAQPIEGGPHGYLGISVAWP